VKKGRESLGRRGKGKRPEEVHGLRKEKDVHTPLGNLGFAIVYPDTKNRLNTNENS